MTSQLYGGNRPGCWGRPDVYDSDSRECRGCGFQSTCRGQVIKLTPAQTAAPVSTNPPYYQQQYLQPPAPFMAPAPAPVPAPVQVMKYQAPPAPAPVAPTYAPAPVRVPVQQMTPQMQMPQLQQDWYGRVQDPLFFTVLSSPPPFRPQMIGEAFFERVAKNLLLDLATLALNHGALALRQMILPPQPPGQ